MITIGAVLIFIWAIYTTSKLVELKTIHKAVEEENVKLRATIKYLESKVK